MEADSRTEDKLTALEAFYRVSRRRKRSSRRLIIVAAVLLALIVTMAVKLHPIVTQMALSNASDLVTSVVNNSIVRMMLEGALDYDELVTLEKDSAGELTALVTNMAKINTLQAEITNAVLNALAGDEYMDIYIPIGNLIGSALLSGRGPGIPVRIVAVSNVGTEFVNEFSGAGINQTRHQIKLDVTVNLTVLLPGKSEDVVVVTEVTVAETVIVGDVPEAYANFKNDKE